MRLLFLISLILAFLISCNSAQQPENNAGKSVKETPEKKNTVKKEIAKKKEEKPKTFNITNENVVKKLTEYGEKHPETILLMKTSRGNMKIRLYENTPLHRANFLLLSKNGFYENTVFYRVIKDFMIQGGDSDAEDRSVKKRRIGRYTIPNEINSTNFHKKGALAMAREYEENPDKKSSSFDFFIVQGVVYSDLELKAVEMEKNSTFSEKQKKLYTTIGGAAHLDGEHTVFGEVIEGLSVIDSIAASRVDNSNWPYSDIKINIEIIK